MADTITGNTDLSPTDRAIDQAINTLDFINDSPIGPAVGSAVEPVADELADAPVYDHVIYLLEDGGSYWPGLVLKPGKPKPVAEIHGNLLEALLRDKIVARCDAGGNIEPEPEAEEEAPEEQPAEEPEASGSVAAAPVAAVAPARRRKGSEPAPSVAPDPVGGPEAEA